VKEADVGCAFGTDPAVLRTVGSVNQQSHRHVALGCSRGIDSEQMTDSGANMDTRRNRSTILHGKLAELAKRFSVVATVVAPHSAAPHTSWNRRTTVTTDRTLRLKGSE
jgi:hypothetical protein